MLRVLRVLPILLTLWVAGCATPGGERDARYLEQRQEHTELQAARKSLKAGRRVTLPAAVRAGHLLDAASLAAESWKQPLRDREELLARVVYNRAVAELVGIIRDHPKLLQPDHPIASQRGGLPYRLRVQQGGATRWDLAYFTSYTPARRISHRGFRQRVEIRGYGAALVGIRDPRSEGGSAEPFSETGQTAAAVTAVADFPAMPRRADARPVDLTLYNPLKISGIRLQGKQRTLAADFTAPLAHLPRRSEFWAGLQAMLDIERYLSNSGLHRLEPFDPDRIPIVFIHGLASTPQMWLDVINELNAEREFRERYQAWVFRYPSGLPLVYTALGLREDLAEVQKSFPMRHHYVLVGHSMGGLISRLQVSDVQRRVWDAALGKKADQLYRTLPESTMLKRATLFSPNPNISSVVFICTPHRGSELAIGSLGNLATSLIRVPSFLVRSMENTVGGSFEMLTGIRGSRFPTSIQSLSPSNPTLKAISEIPPTVRHHSIIGDRGRGDTPNSSDGVVPYWSSHLDTAASELIVPGPHGSYNLPQTIDEMRRILSLTPAARPSGAK